MNIPSRDAECLTAIIESIELAVREEPLAEGRVVDLMALLPDVIRADSSERRIAYLISNCKPLTNIVRLMHPSLQSLTINLAAINALLETLTWCVELQEFIIIEPILTEHLVETNVLPVVLDTLFSRGNENIKVSVVELLFVLVARFVSLGRILSEATGAVQKISHLLFNIDFSSSNSSIITFSIFSEYLSGVLRICSSIDPAKMPYSFIFDTFIFLNRYCEDKLQEQQYKNQENNHNRTIILLAECLTIIISHTPKNYLTYVEAGKIIPLNNIVTVLGNLVEREKFSLIELLDTLLRVEGKFNVIDFDNQTAAYKAILNNKNLWASQESIIQGINIIFSTVNNAITEVINTHLAYIFIRNFSIFCRIILESPQEIKIPTSLIIGLILTKNPQVRSTILNLTCNYIEWSLDILQFIINSISTSDLKNLAIVDVTGTVLNDLSTLPSEKGSDLNNWAESVLTLQEHRFSCNERNQNIQSTIERVKSVSLDDTFFLSCTMALISKACKRSFTTTNSSTKEHRDGYEEWLTRHSGVSRDSLTTKHYEACVKSGKHTPKKRCVMSNSSVSSLTGDKAVSIAVLSHLPLIFGNYFNRAQRRSPHRRLYGPSEVLTQKIHRNTQSSWTLHDVLAGEMYSLFIPFRELNLQRVEGEIVTLERLTRELSRKLITTPTSQRGRRWFLTDMVNNIIPKTELLIRDLADMLQRHGSEGVVYQIGLIRLLDSQSSDISEPLVVEGVPFEVTILSQSVFRDVVHSGNIIYCVTRLRERFSGKM